MSQGVDQGFDPDLRKIWSVCACIELIERSLIHKVDRTICSSVLIGSGPDRDRACLVTRLIPKVNWVALINFRTQQIVVVLSVDIHRDICVTDIISTECLGDLKRGLDIQIPCTNPQTYLISSLTQNWSEESRRHCPNRHSLCIQREHQIIQRLLSIGHLCRSSCRTINTDTDFT